MSEIKCYSLDIPSEGLFNDMDPKDELMEASADILEKYNCLGFHPNDKKGIMHCFFSSLDDRYKAYNEMQAAEIECKLNPLTAWIDEKFFVKKPLP